MLSEEVLGKNIKKIRLSKGMTLGQLSEKTEFSIGYLSKVEKNAKGPPASTLIRIAKGLDVSISKIFGESEIEDSVSLVKKDDRKVIVRGGTKFGYNYEALAYKFTKRAMDPYIITRPPHHKKNMAAFKHKGQEMLFIIEGKMEYFYGSNRFVLEEGDCIYFDSSIEHWGNNIGDTDVKSLLIIYSPESEEVSK